MIIKGTGLRGVTIRDVRLVTSGLLVYLDAANTASLSGPSATTWYDLSGNGWNATSFTGMTYGSSPSPYESFNGAGSATLAANVYNATYTGKTVFVAANCTAISTNTFRAMLGNYGTRQFNFYLYNNASNQNALHFSPGNNAGTISSVIPYTVGTWATFAATQDLSNNIAFYYNGALVSSGNGGGSGFMQYQSGQTEWIGRADNYWYGPIGVVMVYGRALSAAEILQDHNAVRVRYGI